jgi:hypothetical protein
VLFSIGAHGRPRRICTPGLAGGGRGQGAVLGGRGVSPVTEILAELERVMGEAGLRWYLFGAQAAIIILIA